MKIEDWLVMCIPLNLSDLQKYVNKTYPWAKYVVVIDESFKHRHEIHNWCDENLIGRYNFEVVSYFEFEEDSVLFTLKWA